MPVFAPFFDKPACAIHKIVIFKDYFAYLSKKDLVILVKLIGFLNERLV